MGNEIPTGEATYNGYRWRSKSHPFAPRKKMAQKANLTGKHLGRLVVIECLGVTEVGGHRWWGCECRCGKRFAARSRELMRGHTQSCGCLQREVGAKNGAKNKLPYGHASRNELLASYKKSARDRGYEWALTTEHFFELVRAHCAYCDIAPDSFRKPNKQVNGGFWYSGVDRVNPKLGYVEGNVVSCCWNCNRAKGSLTVDQFAVWMDRIAAARSARF